MDKKNYVIGVDGGGTKTVAVLADLDGKILFQAKSGPSNPNKVGIKIAVLNLGEVLIKTSKKFSKEKIKSIYIALAGGLERDKEKREKIKRNLLKDFPQFSNLKKNLKIEGDQKAAFRSGTNKKEGIIIIAGTRSIVMGWRNKKEVISGGWDYILGDQGSGFWLVQKALQSVCKELDGRGPRTKFLTSLILKKWQKKNQGDPLSLIMKKVYQKDLIETVASLAPLVGRAAKKGDKMAKSFLVEAGEELALSAKVVIKKLGFSKKRFPLVLVGGVFKSEIILNTLKKEIKKIAPKSDFIFSKDKPVIGAVKLAIDLVSIDFGNQ